MGSGLIVVDATGTILGAKGIPSVAEDKEQAEAMAALEAVKMAKKKKKMQITNLQLQGDCLNVVNTLKGRVGSIKWTNNAIIRDCLELLKFSNKWDVSYISRATNSVADVLSKNVSSSTSIIRWEEMIPS